MSHRIRAHLRSNIVGYIAIFMFAIGGTAFAIDGPLPGQNQVGSLDIINGEVQQPDIASQAVGTDQIKNNQVRSPDIKNGEVSSDDVLDETLGAVDLGPGSVGSDEIIDESIEGTDIHSAPPFGSGGFNGDVEILDGTILGFDIATNTLTEADIADSVGSAGSGTDGGCNDDSQVGEICATTTFTLGEPGRVLLNWTGDVHTHSAPNAMTCVLHADGSDVGIPQSVGEQGTNHPITNPWSIALTGLTGTLPAGSHTFEAFCTQTDSDVDIGSNQITAARVDG